MNNYQLNYAARKPQMYNKTSRERKSYRIIKILEDYFGKSKLKNLTLLDIGSSTGIMDSILARKLKKVIGIDIDKKAVDFAKKLERENLKFMVEDAMNLSFKDNSFDVVVCTQVYEHVPSAKRLFLEIYRVLKPGGVCYLAAINKLWPWEPHYNLPLLSWFPKKFANFYVRLSGRAKEYYENPKTYWGLKRLTKKFKVVEYTQKILRNPKKFDYHDLIPKGLYPISYVLSPLAKYFAPTFFWLLIKNE
jgi:2-polyprenyl-3-methyl-5-hydroxy-6-metoxy-1,4-benzoquinol methylase